MTTPTTRRRESVTEPTGAALRFPAVIFDMDGVVTDTARLHAAAWTAMFDELFTNVDRVEPLAPFDPDLDYRRYVDGRAREDGVAAVLSSRGIDLAVGERDAPAGHHSVRGLAARKDELFLTLLDRDGVRQFPDAVELLHRLRRLGAATALVTASRNASRVLGAAGLTDQFDVRVDGLDAAALGLAGKPAPDTFLEAARRLQLDPSDCVVVEDAIAGVAAARAGGFGLVVAVDRGGQHARLAEAGADVVVDRLDELDLGAIRTDPWVLAYEGLDPAHEAHREALTALGNGYLATRGAAPESRDDGVHYPGTYLAGVYNRLSTLVAGHWMHDEHLVNAPNWLPTDLRVAEGSWWSNGGLAASSDRRELDLRRGLLSRTAVLSTPDGQRLRVLQRRLVSMADSHLAAMETVLVADGWDGTVQVRSGLDGSVVNGNVTEYAELANRHLRPVQAEEVDGGTVLLEVETVQSHVRVCVAARTTVAGQPASRETVVEDGQVAQLLTLALRDGVPVVVEKVAAFATSRDPAIASAAEAATIRITRAPAFSELLVKHEQAWRHRWARFAVDVDADTSTRLAVNLSTFHLLQTLSRHTVGVDAGVPARGLHGEGYRGHVFWDELFVFPLLTLRTPELTRALLGYRWRRLDEARTAAREAGLRGALFPWQSGSDGREQTPEALFNARAGRWKPDNSRLQRHVGLAVAYNVWSYFQATGDVDFLADRGTELLVEVSRLFASLATRDRGDGRYDIAGVMGPDEYHDGYPDAAEPGLRTNAYTNVLAAWVLARTGDAVQLLAGHHCGELWERIEVTDEELKQFERISRNLRVCFHDRVISQFDGYDRLAELDWDAYRARYGNIGRLDLILHAEGDTTNRYKLAKQADVLMLVYLLGPEGLRSVLHRLGYDLDDDLLQRTVDYYLSRTAHGSTLSRVVHAWALARTHRAESFELFREALRADLDDTQGGTTGEGIHLGAMAGTLDLLLRGYAGIELRDDVLWLDPALPPDLPALAFEIFYRRQRIHVEVSDAQLRLSVAPCQAAPVHVAVAGNKVLAVHPGQHLQFPLPGRRPDTATNNDPGGTAPSTPRPPPRAGCTHGE